MSIVRELEGWHHVFTTTSGKSFRLLPHEEKHISNKEVSEDMRIAYSMRLVDIIEESNQPTHTVKKHIESDKN